MAGASVSTTGLTDDAAARSDITQFSGLYVDNIVRVGVNYHFGSPALSQY
jgi:hypothetical protein